MHLPAHPPARSGCPAPLLAVLVLGLPLAAVAEAAPGGLAASLPPIEVSAAKSDRDPFWMPESISVVTQEAMETRQPVRVNDLLRDLPNVGLGGGPRGVGQTVTIRGLGDERILFQLDGARQSFQRGHNARLFVDPSLLRQVEVLRGPASALWGL